VRINGHPKKGDSRTKKTMSTVDDGPVFSKKEGGGKEHRGQKKIKRKDGPKMSAGGFPKRVRGLRGFKQTYKKQPS